MAFDFNNSVAVAGWQEGFHPIIKVTDVSQSLSSSACLLEYDVDDLPIHVFAISDRFT